MTVSKILAFLAGCVCANLAAAVSCGAVVGVQKLSSDPPNILFIGEWHGTTEVPKAFSEIVCHLAATGRHVHVALEFPADWSLALNKFIAASQNEIQPREELARRWNALRVASPDGRTSGAMWKMLESLRATAAANEGKLRISAFDTRQWEARFPGDFSIGDLGMAAALTREIETTSPEITVVLAGELHARKLPNTVSFKPRPMAYSMTVARPSWNVVTLKADALGGDFWACIKKCAPQPHGTTRDAPRVDAPEIRANSDLNQEGFSGALFVGRFSSSPPFDPASNVTFAEPTDPPWKQNQPFSK